MAAFIPTISSDLDNHSLPNSPSASSPRIDSPEGLLAVGHLDGPPLVSTLNLPNTNSSFFSSLPNTNLTQAVPSLSELLDEDGSSETMLGSESDVIAAADGSFTKTSSASAAPELEPRHDRLAEVGPSLRSPYPINGLVNQRGKSMYHIGLREKHPAPAVHTSEVEERVAQSKFFEQPSGSSRTQRRSRLSMHFPPVFTRGTISSMARPSRAKNDLVAFTGSTDEAEKQSLIHQNTSRLDWPLRSSAQGLGEIWDPMSLRQDTSKSIPRVSLDYPPASKASQPNTLGRPYICWVAAERALRHAQHVSAEVAVVFSRYTFLESEYEVYAGFDEDLIKAGVGYLEQIQVFVSSKSVASPPGMLLSELGKIFAPFSAILFTETSSHYLPVFKEDGRICDYDELVKATVSKFVDFGASAEMPPVAINLCGASGQASASAFLSSGGAEAGDGEGKKERSRKGKERDHGDHQKDDKGESDGDDTSDDPKKSQPDSEVAEHPTISFEVVTELYPIREQLQRDVFDQTLSVTGNLFIQNEPLDSHYPDKFATRHIEFTRLKFGTMRTTSTSYEQYHLRIVVDSRQKNADVALAKPARTELYDKESRVGAGTKTDHTVGGTGSLTIGTTIQGTLSGSGTRITEKTTNSEKKRYGARITQQELYGVVFWGFHIDDDYNQEEGINMPEDTLPSVKFEFLGDTEIAAPPPERIDVEIASYWSIPRPCDKKTWRLFKRRPKSSETVSYSNLCQIVTLMIPSELPKKSNYKATLKVYPSHKDSYRRSEPVVDVRRQVGPTVVKPSAKESQFNVGNLNYGYDVWRQESNLELPTLTRVAVSQLISRGSDDNTGSY